jgi:cytochrome c peroxidase
MQAHVAFLVRWNRNAALLALLVIVAIGLLSCSGGTSGGGGGNGGGGGGGGNQLATFQISVSHTGNFQQNQQNATHTITVTNSGAGASGGNVQVNVVMPSGETLVSMTGTGWSFSGGAVATRSDVLATGQSWPSITLTLNVASNATSPQVVMASVSGGGAATASARDSTTIIFGSVGISTGSLANLLPFSDPSGSVETFTTDSSGQIDTTGPFFQSLGTNGRSCGSCHQPADGWTVSAADVQTRFNQATFDANGVASDPIFRTVDGATCNQGVDLTTAAGRAQAFTLLTSRGLIRIALAVPTSAEFTVVSVNNQYGCGDTSTLSMYRRPLPTTNLRFLSQVMWDGRESSALTSTRDITKATNPADLLADLAHQSVSATRIHAEGASDPTPDQQQGIVNFEMQLSEAQAIDSVAGSLQADGATGGPSAIANQQFSIGVNDPLSTNPPFDPNVFTPFSAWVNFPTNTSAGSRKASIARGEIVFNTKSFTVTGVAGLNDVFFNNGPAVVTCSFCHNDPNLGNHSLSLPLDIGVAEQSTNFLGLSYLPSITLRNKTTGASVTTTDPGVALITGKWADIGKIKIPILRGLAARAPYFHNGSARTLLDVVDFYDFRFVLGFSGQDLTDLVAFLSSL